jgi:hypothetical protein
MSVLVSRKEKILGNGLGRMSRKHIEDNSQASFVSYRFMEKNVRSEGDPVLVHPESNALGKEQSVYARNIQAQEPDQHHHARNDVESLRNRLSRTTIIMFVAPGFVQ